MGVRKIQLILIGLVSFFATNAQEDLLWYFGEGQAGLKFDANGGAPTVANDPAFVIYESISVVSDCEGNLVFYTDGTKVYDASHTLMTNGGGLLGPQENNSNPQSGSSPNGVIVVSDPADSAKYYIFTVGETISGSVNGWRYHVVDMTQPGNGTVQNPMGEVISKNTLVHGLPVAEGQSAVANECGDSIWVVSHGYNTDTLYALPITMNGGIGNLVKTKIGPTLTGTNGSRGSSDFSPNGDKFAMAYLWPGGAHVFDFDFSTGVFSNHVSIPGSGSGVYGVEFSFDGEAVYLGRWTLGTIEHYQIATNTVTTVASPGITVGDLERAPDGKIYVATENTPWLGVINNPDANDGGSAGYVQNGINLGVTIDVGLPQMLTKPGLNLISADITVPYNQTQICDKGGELQLTATPACGVWSGGAWVDNNGLLDPSGLVVPATYRVIYTPGACMVPDTVNFLIEDCCPPLQSHDATICEGEGVNVALLLDTGIGSWAMTSVPTGGSPGFFVPDTFSSFAGSDSGTYAFTYTYWNAPLAECPDSTVSFVHLGVYPTIDFGDVNDTTYECNTSVVVSVASGMEYAWNPSLSNTENLTANADGWYVLTANYPGQICYSSDSTYVRLDQYPTGDIPQEDTLVCGAGQVEIGVDVGGLNYLWSTGATTQNITVSSIGEYSVIVKSGPNGFCATYDTIDVTLAPPFSVDFIGLGDTDTACPQLDTVTVAVMDNPNFNVFNWSNAEYLTQSDTGVTLTNFQDGDRIILEILDVAGCSGSDTVVLNLYCDIKDPDIPNTFTPNNDGTNETFTPINFPPGTETEFGLLFPTSSFVIIDRWGVKMYEGSGYPQWDGMVNGREATVGVYFWIFNYTNINGESKTLNGFVHLIR